MPVQDQMLPWYLTASLHNEPHRLLEVGLAQRDLGGVDVLPLEGAEKELSGGRVILVRPHHADGHPQTFQHR